MQRRTFLLASAAAAVTTTLDPMNLVDAAQMDMPLLAPWTGPHGGGPAFQKVKVAGFKPALLEGMKRNRAEIARIAANKMPPSFANTIAALEDAGRPFGRVLSLYNIYTSTMNDKEMQAVETEMSPTLAAFSDEIVQNAALFARIKAVYDNRKTSGLTP